LEASWRLYLQQQAHQEYEYEVEGYTFVRNVGKHLPVYTAQHPGRLESSAGLL
jgi:hypothetical protein